MSDKIVFKNKPNERIQVGYWSKKGNLKIDYFISRSVAVVGVVFIKVKDVDFVLVTRRSKHMTDEPNKLGLPCGYLDWNERIYDAMIREVYEETSLYIPEYKEFIINDNTNPIRVKDDPSLNRQNISFVYMTCVDFGDNFDAFPSKIINYRNHETAEVYLKNLSDLYNGGFEKHEWAFNHNETIKKANIFRLEYL
jgi:ADP-ribose pyrophosphatase YjhB (NUDIX family)